MKRCPKELTIPKIPGWSRIISSILGIILLVSAIWLSLEISKKETGIVEINTPIPTQLPPNNVVSAPPPLSADSPTGSNLLKNGGFEESPEDSGWVLDGQIDRIAGYSGNNALCSIQTASKDQAVAWIGFTQYVPVTPNQTYRFVAWLKWEDAAAVHMAIIWYDDDYEEVGRSDATFEDLKGSSNGWVQTGGVVTAPENAIGGDVLLKHGVLHGVANLPGSVLCIDDITFVPQ